MAFRLTAKAQADVIDIAEAGLRLFGEGQALEYHRQMFGIFEMIAANPRIARERQEITPPVRVHPFKSHVIIYLLNEMDDVLIVRVRHSHENWMDEL